MSQVLSCSAKKGRYLIQDISLVWGAGREYLGPKRETLIPSFQSPARTLSDSRRSLRVSRFVRVTGRRGAPGLKPHCSWVCLRGRVWRDKHLNRWTEKRRPPPPGGITHSTEWDIISRPRHRSAWFSGPQPGTGATPLGTQLTDSNCDSSQLPQPRELTPHSASLSLCLLWVLLSADP